MANWNLKLDPDDPASYSGGKPAGRGVITASEYVIFAFPPKEGASPIYKTMARWEIAFENQTKLWNEHLYAAYTPGDKVGAGLVPSVDGETPAGGTVADIIDLREGRRQYDANSVPFRGPDIIPVKGGTFADDSELRFALRSLKAASAENAADNQAAVDGVSDRLVLADELNQTRINWMVGLDVEFDRITMAASTKPKKKSNLLGGAADEKKPYTPSVPCPTHIYGKKTAEEVAAIRAEYLANAEAQAAGAGSPQGPIAGPAGIGMGSSAPSPMSTSVMPPGAGAGAGAQGTAATAKKAAKKLAIDDATKERIDGHILAYLATPKKIGDQGVDDRGLITQLMSHVVQKDLKGSGVDLRVASNYIQTLETGDWWEIGAGGLVVLTEDGKSEAVVRAALAGA